MMVYFISMGSCLHLKSNSMGSCMKLKFNSMGGCCLPVLWCIHCRRKVFKNAKDGIFHKRRIFVEQIISLTEVIKLRPFTGSRNP